MWEVFTEGKMPFENKSNLQVVEAISNGFRLYRPHLAPMSIYEVMYRCWHEVRVPCLLSCECGQARHLRTGPTSGSHRGRKRRLFLCTDL